MIKFLLNDGQIAGIVIGSVLAFVILIIIIRAIVVVDQASTVIVQWLGRYRRTLSAGLHFLIPFFERRVKKVSLKEQVADYKPQAVITKDNVTMQIDTVVYFVVSDPKLYTYGVENPLSAMENLTATTLRNIIGDLELDETLTSRDKINREMRQILDEATDPWGIKVTRVELKNIIPPRDIQEAMEKQMRAEREKRESILIAEGRKQSAILIAEGEKQSAVLRAEAEKIQKITVAEGEAQSIMTVTKARAEGVRMINEANPNPAYLTMQGFEALKDIGHSPSTKIIIPSEIQSVAGLFTAMKEVVISESPEKPVKK